MKPLLVMPFDHRGSFERDFLGIDPDKKLNKAQRDRITELKETIFHGFLKAVKKYRHKDYFAVLVDEEFGMPIIKKAKKLGIAVCLPVEASGQEEFNFDYGDDFRSHIKKINPEYAKALVRYNPLNKAVNKKDRKRLKILYNFCRKNNFRLLIELLVPPAEKDFAIVKNKKEYDKKLRITRTVEAIKELKKVMRPDIWKMEGFSSAQWGRIINVINKNSSIILLGRGADEKQVKRWMADAGRHKEIIGFAVGRTVFSLPLKRYVSGKITKQKAADLIAHNFSRFTGLWARYKHLHI